jgi:hypothetical protein
VTPPMPSATRRAYDPRSAGGQPTIGGGVPPTALTRLSATDLARRIRNREVSAREVVDAHIEVLGRWHPKLNVFVYKRFDAAAKRPTRSMPSWPRRPNPRSFRRSSAFPFTCKESITVAGLPNCGASLLAASTAPRRRHRRRGGSLRPGRSSSGSRIPRSSRSGSRPRTASTDGPPTPTTPSEPRRILGRRGRGDRLRRRPARPRDRLRRLDPPSRLLQRHLRPQALRGARFERRALPAGAR